jgi:hypothetical protein
MENNNVKLKRKVQLRRKESEPELVVTQENNDSKKSKTWLWILLGIIALGVIVYAILPKSDKNATESTAIANAATVVTEEAPSATQEQVATEEVNNDTVSDDTNAVPDETNKEAQESAQAKVETSVVNNEPTQPTSVASTSAPELSDDVQAEAMKVIRGDYGIGKKRKELLGSKYQTIQNRVNELKSEGIF